MKNKTEFYVEGGALRGAFERRGISIKGQAAWTKRSSLAAARKLLAKGKRDGFKGMECFTKCYSRSLKNTSRHMRIIKVTFEQINN